jgi:hypothetical protein
MQAIVQGAFVISKAGGDPARSLPNAWITSNSI